MDAECSCSCTQSDHDHLEYFTLGVEVVPGCLRLLRLRQRENSTAQKKKN